MTPQWASVLVSVTAFVVSMVSVFYAREAVHIAAYRTATDLALDVDRIFLENPRLRPYFYDNKELVASDDVEFHRARAAAEYHLDVLEAIWDDREDFTARDAISWREYVHDRMENSPVMRGLYEDHPDWYPTLTDLLDWEPCTPEHKEEHRWACRYAGPQGSGLRFRVRRMVRNAPGRGSRGAPASRRRRRTRR